MTVTDPAPSTVDPAWPTERTLLADRDDFVPEVQAMRRRVVELVPAGERSRELKLGTGGLRDVEFAVQLLQLVHGRNDESLHVASTIDALTALGAAGYIGRDAASLGAEPPAETVAEDEEPPAEPEAPRD